MHMYIDVFPAFISFRQRNCSSVWGAVSHAGETSQQPSCHGEGQANPTCIFFPRAHARAKTNPSPLLFFIFPTIPDSK